MSQVYERTQTGAGSTVPVQLNQFGWPNTTVQVVVTGTVSYTVEATLDNIQSSSPTPTWFAHGTLAAQTASKLDSYSFPVAAIRLTQASGSGTCVLKVLQAGEAGV